MFENLVFEQPVLLSTLPENSPDLKGIEPTMDLRGQGIDSIIISLLTPGKEHFQDFLGFTPEGHRLDAIAYTVTYTNSFKA